MVFDFEKCPDCDGPAILGPGGDGKCSDCDGTGLESNLFDAFAKSLSGDDQKCETCSGTGVCQTCGGEGVL